MTASPLALARAAAQAALDVDGVADLNAGTVGEYATYGSGERQPGVRAVVGDTPRIGLRLVARYGTALPDLVDEVRREVGAAAGVLLGAGEGSRPVVDVHIVDVVDVVPADAAAEPPALPAGAAAAPAPRVVPATNSSTGGL